MNERIFSKELKTFVTMHEMKISDTYFSKRFLQNNVNFKKEREVYLCFCCMNERYSNEWTFDFQKTYVLDFNKRNQKYNSLTICSSYKGMCRHVATQHKNCFLGNTKRRAASDYIGLFVNISNYLNHDIWDGKCRRYLNTLEDVTVVDYDGGWNEEDNEDNTINYAKNCHESNDCNEQSQECSVLEENIPKITSPIMKQKSKRKFLRGFDISHRSQRSNNMAYKDLFATPTKIVRRKIALDSRDNDEVTWRDEAVVIEEVSKNKAYTQVLTCERLLFETEANFASSLADKFICSTQYNLPFSNQCV